MTEAQALWEAMGFIRWPLAFSLLAVLTLTGWSSTRIFRSGAGSDPRTRAWVDAIPFWGGFALVTGVLGTLIGIVVAAQSIEAAGEVSTRLVWGGIKVAMLSSIFGGLILALSGLLWFGLQLRWRLIVPHDESVARPADRRP